MTTHVPPTVLLTRPLSDSRALAAQLGVDCLISPLIEIVPRDAPPMAEALIFTSRNGVAAWMSGGGDVGQPAWCVGPKTAAAAEQAGFVVQEVALDAATLTGLIPADAPPLVHARGEDQRGDLVAALRARGLRAEDAVLYAAESRPLSDEARDAARTGPVLVPLYSPRTAALLVSQWPADQLENLRPIALSPAVAAELPVPAVAVSANPDGQTMVQAILDVIDG